MHTEDEARMKWCPAARMVVAERKTHLILNKANFNRTGIEGDDPQEPHIPRATFCIASDCMAWRWADPRYEYIRTLNLTDDQERMAERIKTHPTERMVWKRPDGEPLPPPGEGWTPAGDMEKARGYVDGVFDRRWKRPRPNQRGYCGLAGKP